MKRVLIAALACAALMLPAQALGDSQGYSRGKQVAKGGEAVVSAERVIIRRGKPKKLVGFRFQGLEVTCAEATIGYSAGPLSPIRVKGDRTFSKNVFFGGGARKLHVEGKVNRAVTRIRGSLRLTGDFPDHEPPLTNCDSGVERFVLS